MLRMMSLDGALAGRAARGRVEGPGGSAQRSIEQDDCSEAENREKRAPAILKPSRYASPKLVFIIR